MSSHDGDNEEIGNERDVDMAKRRLSVIYKNAAEDLEMWKAKEVRALEKRDQATNFLSRLFWQIQYLSAVGNGGELERFMGGLSDPDWGEEELKDEARVTAEAHREGIRRHNASHPAFSGNKP